MYEKFYNLKESPFSLLPDPAYLYMSRQHEMALTLLKYSLVNNHAYTVITGEVGSGKTTLINQLLGEIGENFTVGLINFTDDRVVQLLPWMLQAFDLPYENMSAVKMLTPAAGLKGIKQFALDVLLNAGSKPCPPTILGMGIGGSADISIKLGKEALLRPLDQRHPEPEIAQLETELYTTLNDVGIGPMGLGGKTTILGVAIEYAACHTASLPAAINMQCWAARRAACRIYPDGRIEYTVHGGD